MAGIAKDSSVLLGKHDDGREGAILTKLAQGELVRVPFPNTIATSTVGSSTASHGPTNANPDGSQHGYTLTVPAGLTQGASLRGVVYGRVVGIRFQRSTSTTQLPFTLKVDGVIYAVRNSQARRNAALASLTDNEALFIIADDLLDDGPHTVEVSVAADAPGGSSRQVVLFGWLLEAAKGYSAYPQVGMFPSTPQAVTASAVTITASGFSVRKLCFFNTSGADRIVTVKNGANTFKTITVPTAAPGYAEHDFGQAVDLSSGWTVQADAAGVNLFTHQGVRIR